MVIGYHIIIGAYGFWLPNDPRGSWSTEVWARHLRPFGPASKVDARHSLVSRKHDQARRLEAKRQLRYPPVKFSGVQARTVAGGFEKAADELELKVYACSILPDHVHLVTARHPRDVEYIAGFLKRAASRRLKAEGLHPLAEYSCAEGRLPSPRGDHGWFVYLDTHAQIRQRIRYVEENPKKEGLPPQNWPFVVRYEV